MFCSRFNQNLGGITGGGRAGAGRRSQAGRGLRRSWCWRGLGEAVGVGQTDPVRGSSMSSRASAGSTRCIMSPADSL